MVEIEPSRIVSSIIADRLAQGGESLQALVESIRESGQQVPVLLRPHPDGSDRYQVAYGHRRVLAARELGRTVARGDPPVERCRTCGRAGPENSARTDLSFIERSLFAARLEDAGFERAVIMAALATDKTALSKLIAVARRVPEDIIEAIGPAPKAGRDRWLQLADRLQGVGSQRSGAWASRELRRSQSCRQMSASSGSSCGLRKHANPLQRIGSCASRARTWQGTGDRGRRIPRLFARAP